jgi:hypothetical protein
MMSNPLTLTPLRPPASSKRKALAYAAEIGRLVGEGYTIDAIHEALQHAGVNVSWSAVQRETARVKAASSASAQASAQARSSAGANTSATAPRVSSGTTPQAATSTITSLAITALPLAPESTPDLPPTSPLVRPTRFESWDPRAIDDILQNPPDMEALRKAGLETLRLERAAEANLKRRR